MSTDSNKINTESYRSNGIYFFSAMIPSISDVKRLADYAPALYAKLEQVKKHRQELESASSEAQLQLNAKLKTEELMLQQVVEWIKDCDLNFKR